MPNPDTIAARARAAYLGADDAIPWDELKPVIRERWRAVVEAVTTPVPPPQYDPDDVAFSTPVIADLHKQLEAARREVDEVRRHISVTMSREHQARRELDEVKRERDAALRQRESVPVKVRFDITTSGFNRHFSEQDRGLFDPDVIPLICDCLAAHAVIDVPAGVPSVEELAKIGMRSFHESPPVPRVNLEIGSGWHNAATAIRDAVLAGVAGERMALTETGKPVQWTPTPTDTQVEALARVLHKAYRDSRRISEAWEECDVQDSYCAEARAAFAHIGAPERLKGLPTLDDVWTMITSIVDEMSDSDGNDYVEMGRTDVADLIVALTPYLRGPVGWELDVTDTDAVAAYCRAGIGGVIDLCRSRIRPVFECGECAKLRDEVTFWKRENVASNNKMLAARAALEGEG